MVTNQQGTRCHRFFQEQERRTQDRKRAKLYAQAKELGHQLLPVEFVPYESPTFRSVRSVSVGVILRNQAKKRALNIAALSDIRVMGYGPELILFSQ